MNRVTNKILAILLIAALSGVQFITTGVYAADLISQNSETSEENVKFNATIGNDNSHDSYSYTANIESNDNKMYMSLGVQNTGYLKDISIELQDNNYIFAEVQSSDQRVKSVSSTKLELNQINAGDNIDLSIPIVLDKQDNVSKDLFGKESKVVFNATYVNAKNKEKKIEKVLKQNLSWSIDEDSLSMETSQQIIRYLTYNDQTMLSVLLSDKLKDAKLPINNKEIQITVPELSGKKPSKVIINAIDTANTNGKVDGTAFSNENWIYDENNNVITIKLDNIENKEQQISWNKDLADRFVITYLYDLNMNESATVVTSKVTSKVNLINGIEVINETQANDYTIDGKIGDIVNAEITSNTETLNKGYMYSNLNSAEKRETEYSIDYKINIGLAEAVDKITVKETGEFFNEDNVGEFVYNKRVSISQEELIKLLGENGSINVIKEDGTVVGALNKDTLSIDVNASRITFELSKPVTEGNIKIHVEKAIRGDANFTESQIKNFTTLTSKIVINQEYSKSIALEEPTSKASIEISNSNLSTVVTNNDVVITATLETDDITDALYQNPEISIQLPEEVKNAVLKDATLLYEEELVQNQFRVDGNTIYLSLNGIQTKYASQSTSKGSVVRLVLDITLDNLAPSKDTFVTLTYANHSTISDASNTVQVPVKIVAPTGFVTTNTLSGYNGEESVTSQEGTEATGKLNILSTSKEMTVSGTIVNNLGSDANGVKVLGRIPFKGNKEIGSNEELGSTIDTKLSSGITVDGLDSTVYYSENGEADKDLNNENNGWSTEYTENSKSYLIVANNTVTNTTRANFSYKTIVPENLTYGSTAKANYGIYYDNNAEEGLSQNLVLATKAGVTTGEEPAVKVTNITLKDLSDDKEIEEGGNVREGQYLEYTFEIKNTGAEDVKNVNAEISLPSGYAKLNLIEGDGVWYDDRYEIEYNTKTITQNIESIKAGESIYVTQMVAVTASIDDNLEDDTNTIKMKLTADGMSNSYEKEFTTKLEEAYMTVNLSSDCTENRVKEGQQIKFSCNVENINKETINDTVVTINLPKGIKFVSSNNGDIVYDESSRNLTINIGTLEIQQAYGTVFLTEVESDENTNIEIQAIARCKESQSEVKSKKIIYNNSKYNIKASITSDVPEGKISDVDPLEYYITLENQDNIPVTLLVKDVLPEELYCKYYRIEIDETNLLEKDENLTNEIINTIELYPGQKCTFTITTKPYPLSSDLEQEIINQPEISVIDKNSGIEIQGIEVNSLTHTIQGTAGTSNPGMGGEYKISGTAWIDENGDGRKDIDEAKLSNLRVILMDKVTGNIVKDINGNDIITKTDNNGRYSFNGLNSGSYLVVIEYDTANYEITTYKAEGVIESENSDFVDAILNSNKVATTNTMNITSENIYNIDLGLKPAQHFDLRLDKTVSKITVTNPKLDTQVKEYNKNMAMISLYNTYVEYSTVLVEYNLTVTNEGAVPGYAKEIMDSLPEGMAFSSDLNNDWYMGSDGNLYTTSLANKLLQPGETATVKLILTRKMTGENTGTVHNVAEITKAYNEYGKEDVDSVPGNNKDGEDDKSYADVIITMGTGKEVASFIGITLGILSIIAVAVILIKKYIIKRI